MSTQEDIDERRAALALFGLDEMADEWAQRTSLHAMARSIVADDAQANKLVALMKQAWVEGAYEGRISQFTDPPSGVPQSE